MDRPSDEQATILWLVEIVPELRPLLEEHLECYDEVLPYVVFESDFTGWVIERARGGDHEQARRFVESLALDDCWADVVSTIRSWMGPRTARDFDAYLQPPTATQK
ncbi:hypothetical protein OJ998_02335 [Solirubrobacter taibaiensis]|nr:hypothetical protein [Solirubrobacter taibaiensis]